MHQVCICARTHLTHELTANTSVGTVPRGPAANNKPSRTRETQAAKHPIENAPLQPPPHRCGEIHSQTILHQHRIGVGQPRLVCTMLAAQSMQAAGLFRDWRYRCSRLILVPPLSRRRLVCCRRLKLQDKGGRFKANWSRDPTSQDIRTYSNPFEQVRKLLIESI